MNKIFEYENYKFSIDVELDYKIEEGFNGNRWYKLIIKNLGKSKKSKFYLCSVVLSENLELKIKEFEQSAKDYVDNMKYLCMKF